MTYLRSSSNSFHFEFQKAFLRIENAAKYTIGCEYSRKRFFDITIQEIEQATPGIQRREGIEKSGSDVTNALVLFSGEAQKKPGRQKVS